jgi:ATP-dependent Clp protease ATP-binding subunit ClpC
MTSTVGAQQLQRDTSIGFRPGVAAEQAAADYERMKGKVLAELKNVFRPEFLNRIDATIVFRQLTREEIREIVDLLLVRVKNQLAGQQMELVVTDAAKDSIIEKGYDQAMGARPLRREIQNQIEDALAERMLMAAFEAGDRIIVDAAPDGSLTIEREAGRALKPVEVATPAAKS